MIISQHAKETLFFAFLITTSFNASRHALDNSVTQLGPQHRVFEVLRVGPRAFPGCSKRLCIHAVTVFPALTFGFHGDHLSNRIKLHVGHRPQAKDCLAYP